MNDFESLSEVIQGHIFWRQSKARVRLYIGCSIFNRFGDTAGFVRTEPFFYTPLQALLRLKFWDVPIGVDPRY